MARICSKCTTKIDVEEYAKCGECSKYYHFDCSITENSYNKITRSKKIWKCIICSGGAETRFRTGSSSTTATNKDIIPQPELVDIKKMLEIINFKINGLELIKSEIQELNKTVTFLSHQYDAVLLKLDENNKVVKEHTNIIKELQEKNQDKDIIIFNLREKLENIEQYSRNKNIEINGVKELPHEDCKEIVVNIAKELDLNISKNDIDIAHRLHTSKVNISRSIVVQFKTRTIREQIAHKRFMVVSNKDINGTPIGSKIYINEHLTTYYKNLIRQAKIKQRETGFKFVWFRNNKLLARRTEDSPVIWIQNEEDIKTKMIVLSRVS